jgi:hypothetical protein
MLLDLRRGSRSHVGTGRVRSLVCACARGCVGRSERVSVSARVAMRPCAGRALVRPCLRPPSLPLLASSRIFAYSREPYLVDPPPTAAGVLAGHCGRAECWGVPAPPAKKAPPPLGPHNPAAARTRRDAPRNTRTHACSHVTVVDARTRTLTSARTHTHTRTHAPRRKHARTHVRTHPHTKLTQPASASLLSSCSSIGVGRAHGVCTRSLARAPGPSVSSAPSLSRSQTALAHERTYGAQGVPPPPPALQSWYSAERWASAVLHHRTTRCNAAQQRTTRCRAVRHAAELRLGPIAVQA